MIDALRSCLREPPRPSAPLTIAPPSAPRIEQSAGTSDCDHMTFDEFCAAQRKQGECALTVLGPNDDIPPHLNIIDRNLKSRLIGLPALASDDDHDKDFLAYVVIPGIIREHGVIMGALVSTAWGSLDAATTKHRPSQALDKREMIFLLCFALGIEQVYFGFIARTKKRSPKIKAWETCDKVRGSGRFSGFSECVKP
jgi:hypothetical protein